MFKKYLSIAAGKKKALACEIGLFDPKSRQIFFKTPIISERFQL
jgi:hypothetical protein